MMTKDINYQKILEQLKIKAAIKQAVYQNTMAVLENIKLIFQSLVAQLNTDYQEAGKANVEISYQENNTFEAVLKLGGDVIIASMHSNIFDFEPTHPIHQTQYVQQNPLRSYCGKIYIYNFLADSIKYNRLNDSGWKVARIFVNCENHFFMEGNGQLGFLFNNLAEQIVNPDILSVITEIAILQSLENDLTVEPFETQRFLSLMEKQATLANAGVSVSKQRLGYQFQSELKDKNI